MNSPWENSASSNFPVENAPSSNSPMEYSPEESSPMKNYPLSFSQIIFDEKIFLHLNATNGAIEPISKREVWKKTSSF